MSIPKIEEEEESEMILNKKLMRKMIAEAYEYMSQQKLKNQGYQTPKWSVPINLIIKNHL